jgi:hypothetical protein
MLRFAPFLLCLSFSGWVLANDPAADQSPDEASAAAAESHSETPASPFAPAVFKVIESTQHSLDEMYDPIESEMAEVLKNASKQLLADPAIFKGLTLNAEQRFQADKASEEEGVDDNPARYAKLAMAGLQSALRMSPGVMTRQELMDRALLIAAVAKYYERKDPTLCRYLPQDFTVLLNVDAPWVAEVDQDILEKAIEGERSAVMRMFSGINPIIIVDVDVQNIFSKFAGEWYSGLPDQEQSLIGIARNSGNFCPLWSTLLKDAAKMSTAFPKASQKVLLPLLTMPTRGWLDVGSWDVIEKVIEE